jgi:hypothetical protein
MGDGTTTRSGLTEAGAAGGSKDVAKSDAKIMYFLARSSVDDCPF